jgi:hypothetical protein
MSDEQQLVEAPITGVVASPFGAPAAPQERSANVEVAAAREIAEVQAHLIMAHRMPRDERRSMDRIIQACTRPTLAQTALYAYSRGGTEITGPSIRLAEVLGQNWGNLKFGWREVERVPAAKDPVSGRIRPGRSTISTYCTDLETNVTDERSFQMIHERSTRSGSYRLEDDRDIYEAAANQAARRMRACILAIIPGDIVETAVAQCEETMLAKADTSPEAVDKLVKAFERFGVTREQIELRIQRRIDTIRPAQIVQLRKTWKSLDDGMSVASDWFQPPKPPEGQAPAPEPEAKGSEGLKAKLRGAKAAESPPEGMEVGPRPSAPADSTPAADQAPGEAATPASGRGTAGGTSVTGDDTSGEHPQNDARTAATDKPTSDSATSASQPSPGQKASGRPARSEPSSAGELPLREPGEEG